MSMPWLLKLFFGSRLSQNLESHCVQSACILQGVTGTVFRFICIDAEVRGQYTWTTLMSASWLGHLDVVNILFTAGTQILFAQHGLHAHGLFGFSILQ